MTRTLAFVVHGLPAAQGSKRHVGNGVMVESSKAVKPWRQDVTAAAVAAITQHTHWEPFTGPVTVHTTYFFTRPKAHYRTGKNAHVLKPSAPEWVAKKPDIEKVVRATHDALTTAGVWRDDSQVARLDVTKKYAAAFSGAEITIREITE